MRQAIRFGLLSSVLVLAACGKHHTGGDDDTDGGIQFDSIRIEPATATVTVALGSTATQTYQVIGEAMGQDADITSECSINVDPSFGTSAAAVVTVGGHGGVATVTAGCGQLTGTAQLTVNLNGTLVVGANTPANAADIFAGATATVDANRMPGIQYPIDQAVAPLNIPPIEVQWSTAGNDLFHISLTSSHQAIDVYTSDAQATMPADGWESVAGTAAGEKLVVTVEGLTQATPTTKYASTTSSLVMSHDTIDTSAIYWWASSQGSIMTQTFGETSAPTVVEGNCSGCHALSRSGSRIGYSRCVGGSCNGNWVGFLKFNPTTNAWDEPVNADLKQIQGSFSTFAPVGNPFPDDTQALAAVTRATGVLSLFDPDTGTAIASNLDTQSVLDPAGTATKHSALMPDWSADGNHIVFTSTPHPGQSVDLSDGSIATMDFAYANGTSTFTAPRPLVTPPITLSNGSYTNLFFPSYSPDGALVVFNAAREQWRQFGDAKTGGQRLMLADATTGQYTDLTNLNGGMIDADITWPHWAPGSTADYYWVVFSSERNYGHELTAGNTNSACVANGVKQCKQIWISAISKAQLAAGLTIDPSAPPMWVPGQDIKADNISPYWTKPTQIQ